MSAHSPVTPSVPRTNGWTLSPDRALPAEPVVRAFARTVLEATRSLPIVSMHGHVDAAVLARDEPFADPAALLVTPDHYLVRTLVSQSTVPGAIRESGVRSVADLGVGRPGDPGVERDPRTIWRRFCAGWPALRGTPTRFWLEHVLVELFSAPVPPSVADADLLYDHLCDRLAQPEFRPRAVFERFGIEMLATTDPATSALDAHRVLASSGWGGRVIPTFRPDALLEAGRDGWNADIHALETASSTDATHYDGFLDALRAARRHFIRLGARATDHGHLSARIASLSDGEAASLYARARTGALTPAAAADFTAHLLFEMARMSTQDGLVMQFHPGVLRDHDRQRAARSGHDLGYDIPVATGFTRELRPVLEEFGSHENFRLIVFTVDETAYTRELAPLAGVYPALRLGAPWWFLDAPDAMARYRSATTEIAGFCNTSGFVDDTRAFCSIPARHDLSRRADAGFLARLVAEHRLTIDEACEVAIDLAYRLPLQSYPVPVGGERA